MNVSLSHAHCSKTHCAYLKFIYICHYRAVVAFSLTPECTRVYLYTRLYQVSTESSPAGKLHWINIEST